MQSSWTGKRTQLLLLFFIYFLDTFSIYIVVPIFPKMILRSEFQVLSDLVSIQNRNLLLGLLLGSFSLAQFYGAPLWGSIADRIGRKKTLIITILGTFLTMSLTSAAVMMRSYTFILIARLLNGFFAANQAICLASIVDVSEDENQKRKNLGIITTFQGFSWVSSMLLGWMAFKPDTIALPLWINSALLLFAWIIVYFFFQETANKQSQSINIHQSISNVFDSFLTKPVLYLGLMFWFLGWILSLQWLNTLFIEEYHITGNTTFAMFLMIGVIWTIGSSGINRFVVKLIDARHLVLFGTLVMGVIIVFQPNYQNFKWFFSFYLIAACLASIILPNILDLISTAIKIDDQGRAMGMSQSMISLAQLLAPFIGGMITHLNLHLLYPFAALAIAISLIFFLTQKKPI